MKKILVTGGAGYIGSHTVVELAQAGYLPVVVDNFSNSDDRVIDALISLTDENLSYHRADCTKFSDLHEVFDREETVAGVIHFAAFKAVGESVRNPFKYYRNNVNGTLNILEVMQQRGVGNFVFSSSCTVYGQPESLPVDESSSIAKVVSPYGHTKQICEQMIDQYHRSFPDFNSIILRYFNPIGAHPSAAIGEFPLGKPENLVPFITQTAAGIRDKLTIFGHDYSTKDGTCIRDYIHVVDLARAHVKALKFLENSDSMTEPEIVNLGLGKGFTVKEVVDAFEKISGVKLNFEYGKRRSGDVESIYSSSKKAERLLNWKCEYGLEDMLRHAWKWQQELDS